MRNNELSNRQAPTLLVRVEDFLVLYKEKTAWDNIANFIVGKERRAYLNEDVVSILQLVFRNTDMTVDLVIDRKNFSIDVNEMLSNLPYGRILQIDKPVQISTKLNTGEYIYYIDNDLERISQVGNKRTISLELLHSFIKGGFTFE